MTARSEIESEIKKSGRKGITKEQLKKKFNISNRAVEKHLRASQKDGNIYSKKPGKDRVFCSYPSDKSNKSNKINFDKRRYRENALFRGNLLLNLNVLLGCEAIMYQEYPGGQIKKRVIKHSKDYTIEGYFGVNLENLVQALRSEKGFLTVIKNMRLIDLYVNLWSTINNLVTTIKDVLKVPHGNLTTKELNLIHDIFESVEELIDRDPKNVLLPELVHLLPELKPYFVNWPDNLYISNADRPALLDRLTVKDALELVKKRNLEIKLNIGNLGTKTHYIRMVLRNTIEQAIELKWFLDSLETKYGEFAIEARKPPIL